MSSRGIKNEDLTAVRKVRTTAPRRSETAWAAQKCHQLAVARRRGDFGRIIQVRKLLQRRAGTPALSLCVRRGHHGNVAAMKAQTLAPAIASTSHRRGRFLSGATTSFRTSLRHFEDEPDGFNQSLPARGFRFELRPAFARQAIELCLTPALRFLPIRRKKTAVF